MLHRRSVARAGLFVSVGHDQQGIGGQAVAHESGMDVERVDVVTEHAHGRLTAAAALRLHNAWPTLSRRPVVHHRAEGAAAGVGDDPIRLPRVALLAVRSPQLQVSCERECAVRSSRMAR